MVLGWSLSDRRLTNEVTTGHTDTEMSNGIKNEDHEYLGLEVGRWGDFLIGF